MKLRDDELEEDNGLDDEEEEEFLDIESGRKEEKKKPVNEGLRKAKKGRKQMKEQNKKQDQCCRSGKCGENTKKTLNS